MLQKKAVFIMVSFFLCSSNYSFAENMESKESPVNMEEQEVKKEVGNKICPIEGAKIGSMGEGVKVEHEGMIYNLCCVECIKVFNEDPEKYHKIADKEVGMQTEEDKNSNEHADHKEDDDHSQEHK